MLMWRLSVNLMSSGASLAARRNNTGSGTRTTQKRVAYWPTLLVHVPMKPVVNCWHCSHPLISECWPLMSGGAILGRFRKKSTWPARFLLSALSAITWRWEPESNGWPAKRSVFHVLLSSMKKSSGHSSKNTYPTNWMSHPIIVLLFYPFAP